jgi:hypothetical protein
LRWAAGRGGLTPGGRVAWRGAAPTPEQVDAEQQLLVGRMYRSGEPHAQAAAAGAWDALWWALGREETEPSGEPEPDGAA